MPIIWRILTKPDGPCCAYLHTRALPCTTAHWITVIRVKDQFTEGFKWALKYMSQNLPQTVTKLGPISVVTQLRSGSRQVCGITDHIHRLMIPGYPVPTRDLSNQAFPYADSISSHACKMHYANKHTAVTSLKPKPTHRQASKLRHPNSALTSMTHDTHESHTTQFPVWTLEIEERFRKIYSEGLPLGEQIELRPPAPFPSY